jgi:hypothetical protein
VPSTALASRQQAPGKQLARAPARLKRAETKQSTFPSTRALRVTRSPWRPFIDILKGLFGRNWWYVSPSVLGVRLPTIYAYGRHDGVHVPLARLARLERYSRQLPAWLEEWRVAEHAAVDAEAARRLEEIAGARTALKAYTLERERLEAERERKKAEKAAVRKALREAQAGRAR